MLSTKQIEKAADYPKWAKDMEDEFPKMDYTNRILSGLEYIKMDHYKDHGEEEWMRNV